MDATTLARLNRWLGYRTRLAEYKLKLRTQGESEGWWVDTLQSLVDSAQSVAHVDGLTRNIRSRKSSRILAEKDPRLSQIGLALLTWNGPTPSDLHQWVAEQASVPVDQAPALLGQVKHWLQVLLSEDAPLLQKLGRQILRRGQVTVKLLADQPEKDDKDLEKDSDKLLSVATEDGLRDEASTESQSEEGHIPAGDESHSSPAELTSDLQLGDAVVTEAVVDQFDSPIEDPAASIASEQDNLAKMDEALSGDVNDASLHTAEVVESGSTDSVAADKSDASVDPLLAAFPKAPAPKVKVTKAEPKKPIKPLSPRQRRRKWLRSILQRYSKLRKPLSRIGHYQALMLGRGQRSQIISMKIEYDRQNMVQMAREALSAVEHPLSALLNEVAEESLNKIILPRLEHDVFSELEETAHHELTEMAVRHLQNMIDQRPVRGHRILLIDAMGPKSAAIAIVDPNGHVDFVGELPSISTRPDIVAQNVATLGQWIHTYKVTLVAISNGNTRRYLLHSISELMKQSGDSGLRWTTVDRTGADAYCETRLALQELPKVSKRHRAAVWLAWRLQDPLIEITKVDPARLRLGSYQRELPQETLEAALEEAVSASVAARGIDVWNSHEKSLICLPGISSQLAKTIVALRDAGTLSTREKLLEALRESASDNQLKQAIGFLRLFGSEQPLDGTMIHPDDYRLAERLIAAGPLAAPGAAPEGWQKPTIGAASSEPASASGNADSTQEAAEGDSETVSDAEAVVAESENSAMAAPESEPLESEPLEQSIAPGEAPSEAVEATGDAALSEGSVDPSSQLLEIPSFAVTTDKQSSQAEPVKSAAPVLTLAPTNPQVDIQPEVAPALAIDVEKLARSWQVGREKLRCVARCLQQPFADLRNARMPIPLMDQVPSMSSLKPGMTAWGTVIGVADFGAFVDLGPDCNGLIHVSRLSAEFVEDPHEVVQIGDLLQVWVLNVDTEKNRIALSALPPGVEPPRRPSFNESNEGNRFNDRNQGGRVQGNREHSNANRGGQNRPEGQGNYRGGQAGRGNASNPAGQTSQGARPNSSQEGNRSGGRPAGNRPQPAQGGNARNQGQGYGGQGQRSGFNRDRNRRREDEPRSIEVTSKKPPAKPAAPLTDAMQDGKEPMRSFSDLLQFYQTKRDDDGPTKTKGSGKRDNKNRDTEGDVGQPEQANPIASTLEQSSAQDLASDVPASFVVKANETEGGAERLSEPLPHSLSAESASDEASRDTDV